MTKARLEAFSDGVFAVIITIMVLEIKVPHGAELHDLAPLWPPLLGYLLSFIFVGVYWVNHHHLLHATHHVSGPSLWGNLHLLFWLSLVPLVTSWLGEHPTESWPAALYGIDLFFAAVAWVLMQRLLLLANGPDSPLARAVGDDVKGKASAVLLAAAVALAFVRPWLSDVIYVLIAALWFIPDRRIESELRRE